MLIARVAWTGVFGVLLRSCLSHEPIQFYVKCSRT